MARFQSLSQVGLVLAEVVKAETSGTPEVLVNVPVEDPMSSALAVRITLLWTTPQPGHRSDPPEANFDGTMAPPPPTLSAWYIISTQGATPTLDAIGAHDLLGQIIRAFHAQPTLTLPIDSMGEGLLHVTQVPVDPEVSEKIWVPLQVKQRPWVLFDVGPIQLLRTEPPEPEQPRVYPGGIRLAPIEAAGPPLVHRITPSTVGVGGRIRIDATYPGDPARVSIRDARAVPLTAEQIIPPDIAAMSAGGPVLATLPATIPEGTYDLQITGEGDTPSAPGTLTIVPTTIPSVDAPSVLTHSRAVSLVLDARGLNVGPAMVFFWPDAGIAAPDDVVSVTGQSAGNAVTIQATDLAPLRDTVYRISVQHSAYGFTPYVLLEMIP